jgi:hypothetical protein
METIRTLGLAAWLVALGALGCSREPGGNDEGGADPPPGWRIDVDLTGLDRFVPEEATRWTVAGRATASEGLAGVEVAGGPAALADGGAFTAEVDVAPGLTIVPIVARDGAGHARQAHRSLLAARFLPEGEANRDAAALVLGDPILAAMGASLAGEAAEVDVAAEILARPVLSQDDRCITWPVSARQGTVAVRLVRDGSALWLHIRIPGLYVYFEGRCQGLLSQIPIAGELAGTIDVWSRLDAVPPQGGAACITRFAHSRPQVSIAGWQFRVWGTSGPLQSWIVQLFSGSKSEEARQQIAAEVRARADQLLGERLADVALFDGASPVELLDRPVELRLCLAALEASAGQLVARVAAAAEGLGVRSAPGAPQLGGAVPAVAPGELLLDANLVAQLLFAAWRDGGLARADVTQVELSLLALLVPELRRAYPDARHVDVSIDGELPPWVRATPEREGADLRIELGDLMLDLSIGGERLFRFGVHLVLDLALTPAGGALVPTVVDSRAQVVLLEERFDAPDDAMEDAVRLQIGQAAADLLAGAALALPDLPGLGAPVEVTADAGGRYLRVRLE